jgi:hypothetical protein
VILEKGYASTPEVCHHRLSGMRCRRCCGLCSPLTARVMGCVRLSDALLEQVAWDRYVKTCSAARSYRCRVEQTDGRAVWRPSRLWIWRISLSRNIRGYENESLTDFRTSWIDPMTGESSQDPVGMAGDGELGIARGRKVVGKRY